MNILTDRCKSILIELFNNEIVTLRYIEEKIKYSKKTILKDLDIIEKVIAEYNIQLIRKPNKGLWLCGCEEDLSILHKFINIEQNDIPSTSEERQTYILTRLINSNDYVTIQELADEIYVSKGTITNELLKISEYLNDSKIYLEKKQNKGMIIRGEEKDIREAYAKIITEQNCLEYVLNVVSKSEKIDINKHSENIINSELQQIFDKEYISIIANNVKFLERELDYDFSDSAFAALVIHIVIAIRRIKEGKQIKTSEISLKELSECKEYKMALKLVQDIERDFKIKVPKEEVGYITMHILGSKILKMKRLTSKDNIINKAILDNSLKDIILDMIRRAEEVLQVRLVDNDDLYNGLFIHVRPAINRLINNMPIKNPYLYEIKRKYPLAFEAAVKAFDVLKEKYSIKSSEDEIAYIALHIEAALEGIKQLNKKEIKVLVVCSTGMGTSQLISAKLKRLFSNLKIIDILSAINIENNPLINEVDFIISSIPIYIENKTVINVNPFLEDSDIDKIRKNIKMVSLNNKIEGYKKFVNIYNKELVFLDIDSDDYEEVIKKICIELERKGYVTKDFMKTVINRENISSTSYDGMAIPHGDVNEVIKPFISICVLKKRLRWEDYKVNIVFLTGVNESIKHSLKDIFDNLYELIEDKNRINQILQCKDSEEIINIVLNKNQ
ncbi:BglG family transcription antiterminator [Clostridium neonatale]|uniref:BglG family transcription antiterminator n=1 Tax=Clostridium neonatale TaxID=137838 RepID=UPI00291C1FFF|nr:activator of the mannose operon, transcriptional antiterminator [Clostridium neonatale]